MAETGAEILITKRGNPVARLSTYRERPKTLYGKYRGQIKICGDLDDSLELIVATALEGDHRLVTADGEILAWPGPLRRLPAGV